MNEIMAVRPGDSFDHWHHVTCRQFSLTECNTVAGRDFQARVTIRQFGELTLNRIWSSTRQETIRVARRPEDIRKDRRDCFMLWLMREGTAQLAQNGRHAELSAGDMVLQDQARPFDLELGRLAHADVITVPRPLLASRFVSAGTMAARRIPAMSRMGPMSASVVKHLFAMAETPEEATDRRFSVSVVDMLSTILEAESNPHAMIDRLEGRLEEVKTYMRGRMHHDLDVETIAHDMSMAIRTVYRLFAREATTPMLWLKEQRLMTSYRLLNEQAKSNVTDVAISCGFKDVSHFSKAFRARFGVQPSTIGRGRQVRNACR